MILIKLKFTGNRFISTCCSEDVELGVIDPKDINIEAEAECGSESSFKTADERAAGA